MFTFYQMLLTFFSNFISKASFTQSAFNLKCKKWNFHLFLWKIRKNKEKRCTLRKLIYSALFHSMNTQSFITISLLCLLIFPSFLLFSNLLMFLLFLSLFVLFFFVDSKCFTSIIFTAIFYQKLLSFWKYQNINMKKIKNE